MKEDCRINAGMKADRSAPRKSVNSPRTNPTGVRVGLLGFKKKNTLKSEYRSRNFLRQMFKKGNCEEQMAKRCIADDGWWKRKMCTSECIYFDKCVFRNNKEYAKKQRAKLLEEQKILKQSSAHTIGELQLYQSYSLERKIQLTAERIRAWYEWWDGQVYISFSWGKDSTVLLDIVRNVCGYDDIPAVFVDTGL